MTDQDEEDSERLADELAELRATFHMVFIEAHIVTIICCFLCLQVSRGLCRGQEYE